MNSQIIFANLRARPVRTLVSVLAVGLEVTLILVVVGLTTGISVETGKRTEGVGADLMLQPPGASLFTALNTGSMPTSLGNEVQKLENVTAVCPILTVVNTGSGGLEVIYGMDPEKFAAVSGGFTWLSGRMFSSPDEMVVDDLWARSKKAKVGDEITLLNQKFKLSGIVEHGKGARVFIPIKKAEEMSGHPGYVSMFYIKLRTPDDTTAVKAKIEQLLPTYPVLVVRDFTSLLISTSIPALDAFINVVVFVAVCIGVLVIFLSMYTTITERTREIGILRSLGASKSFIVFLIFQESVMVCVLGVIGGIALSYAIANVVPAVFPTLIVMITRQWVVRAAFFSVVSGILGSLYPSMKAAAQDPIEALAYE